MRTETDLAHRTDQLNNVSYRLDSLIALNEKNAKESPDAEKLKDLEGRVALHQDAAATHRAEVDIQKAEYEQRLRTMALDLKVKERELEALREELKVAHERAFEAETRLGREQALSRDLSAQLNQLRYHGAAATARSATSEPSSATAPAKTTTKSATAKVRTELDDLDLDLDIPDIPDIPDLVLPPSTVTKATSSVAPANPAHPKVTVATAAVKKQAVQPARTQKDWGDIDDLLDDIQKTGQK